MQIHSGPEVQVTAGLQQAYCRPSEAFCRPSAGLQPTCSRPAAYLISWPFCLRVPTITHVLGGWAARLQPAHIQIQWARGLSGAFTTFTIQLGHENGG